MASRQVSVSKSNWFSSKMLQLNLGRFNQCVHYSQNTQRNVINSSKNVFYCSSESDEIICDKPPDDCVEEVETPDLECIYCHGTGQLVLFSSVCPCDCAMLKQVSIVVPKDRLVNIPLFDVGGYVSSGRIHDPKVVDDLLSCIEMRIFEIIRRILQKTSDGLRLENVFIFVHTVEVFDDESKNITDGCYGWAEIGVVVTV